MADTTTDPNLRFFRILECICPTPFALFGVLALVKGNVGAGIGLLAFAAFAVLMFELRMRAHRAKIASVESDLALVGQEVFDEPRPIERRPRNEHLEEISMNPRLANLMAQRSVRLAAIGTWRGRTVEVGAAIVAARDFDQTLSYVRVPGAGAGPAFRAMTRGGFSTLLRWGVEKHPVATGDAAFDKDWIVDAEEATARAVLDPAMRRQLMTLSANVQSPWIMSIEATRAGLVIRWPGSLLPGGAAALRDLAIELSDKLAA